MVAYDRSLYQILESSNRCQSQSSLDNISSDEDSSQFQLQIQQLQARVTLLESSLNEQRKIYLELVADLKIALAEGIKYRDSLKKMIEIRELESIRSMAHK